MANLGKCKCGSSSWGYQGWSFAGFTFYCEKCWSVIRSSEAPNLTQINVGKAMREKEREKREAEANARKASKNGHAGKHK